MPDLAEISTRVEKALLKRPQTAAELVARIGKGWNVRALSRALPEMARSKKLLKHDGRPPKYSKV